ncbi:DNA polymerase III subunit delta' [Bifidobacterium magnum]|uniref:DNA polymerase III subunit delta n=1 Tax=Bifidobacterium magnum TaxID=1692 RepID=A0A087BAV7_9BIFI|nr:DNA polymerase III subunit delta' [Bifidobacterium magnum]KFI68157.1 DNA polymerase III subunit delta [Bifidobacterium magnum]
MSVWDTVVGQHRAVEQLKHIATGDPAHIAQAWMICGPEGSGRAAMARAFAAALEYPVNSGEPVLSPATQQVLAGTHPDVTVLTTKKNTISIQQVRELITHSEEMPNFAPWRIIIIEDFERMLERTTNVLLKEIEEPSAHTIWILCAPSAQDVLPTIQSRTRVVNLAVPQDHDVAAYLRTLPDVDEATAERSARYAQGNVNEAELYALNSDARSARDELVHGILTLHHPGDAVALAKTVLDDAQAQAEEQTQREARQTQEEFLRMNGVASERDLPRELRPEFAKLARKKDLDALAKRQVRDMLSRALTTVASVYRDIGVLQNGAADTNGIVNREYQGQLGELAASLTRADVVRMLESIATARRRIMGNGNARLDLEAMLCSLMHA